MHLPMLYTAYIARPIVICRTICKTIRNVKKSILSLLYWVGILSGSKWKIIEILWKCGKSEHWHISCKYAGSLHYKSKLGSFHKRGA